MAKEVIKKDGTKEPFDAGKIRSAIAAAAAMTDLPEEKKDEVIEQVASTVIQIAEGQDEMATSEIRQNILSELDSVEPAISAAWRKYEQEKGGE